MARRGLNGRRNALAILGVLLAASSPGVARAPVDVPPAAPDHFDACDGIYPGMTFVPQGLLARTGGFIFRDQMGRLYLSAAGTSLDEGQRVEDVGDDEVGVFGTVRFARAQGLGSNFALIEIDADKVPLVSPRVCHWGGPVAVYPRDQSPALLEQLKFYFAQDFCLSDVSCRALPVLNDNCAFVTLHQQQRWGRDCFFVAGALVYLGIYGYHTGVPVLTPDGRAIGITTGLFVPTGFGGTRVERAIELVVQATNGAIRPELVTAPLG